MCGINGILAKSEKGKAFFKYLHQANEVLHRRGPNATGHFESHRVALGHRRLSIIDLSNTANQPMWDTTQRCVIVFNGEIFNYKELKEELLLKGVQFNTQSDTEVILELYKIYHTDFVQYLNGFFAFIIYDTKRNEVFVARDRYGIKPLWTYEDEDVIIFSSELKGLLQYPIPRELNETAIGHYFQFNYVPPDESILKNINKFPPATYRQIVDNKDISKSYYQLPSQPNVSVNYENAQQKFVTLLDASVQRRLISDVPIGAFLSGGIDSSVVVALASRHTAQLNTFSIGYKDDPFYDETHYAELVAERFKTNHTVFKLTQEDVLGQLDEILSYLDEPFADSSALPVYVLSKQTRNKVTVALSGDGADEIFGGYMKHWAEYRVRHSTLLEQLAVTASPIARLFPKSRASRWSNRMRQWQRFAEGHRLTAKERYIRWCSIGDREYVNSLLIKRPPSEDVVTKYAQDILTVGDLNDVLRADVKLVLAGDMLVKVDLMSMANSLEVRVPFLDYTVVDFAFSLPSEYKVDRRQRKKIVQDAFRNILPAELYNRPKKGFEVPLLEWLRGPLLSRIRNEWLQEDLLRAQGLFNIDIVQGLIRKLQSANPEDAPAKIWALIQFQNFWMRYIHK